MSRKSSSLIAGMESMMEKSWFASWYAGAIRSPVSGSYSARTILGISTSRLASRSAPSWLSMRSSRLWKAFVEGISPMSRARSAEVSALTAAMTTLSTGMAESWVTVQSYPKRCRSSLHVLSKPSCRPMSTSSLARDAGVFFQPENLSIAAW